VKNTAIVQLTARLIDTETGEIIATAQGQGSASAKSGGTSVLGIGGSTANVNNDSLLTQAANDAVSQMVTVVAQSESKLSAYSGTVNNAEGMVADITDGQVTLNKGAAAGFATGMKVSIERVSKVVKDPATGKVIRTVSSPIGEIQLTEVTKDYAVGRIVSGAGFKAGDTAKAK
jgi:hypothetical protein